MRPINTDAEIIDPGKFLRRADEWRSPTDKINQDKNPR